ncbi:DUF2336 domain-containing protein [Elioraea thermophila]|uniref:DUF2336 domain-containing protein n=1 Tax=Elioraea thermophila TaxID=2185104 RepID=UPI001300B18D|nr:DUF2336 domain-containing protein [Elioraea thermophila]
MNANEYEEAKRIARAGTVEERAALARRSDMPPELLFYLAADQEGVVRAAVAANDTTPAQANRLLAEDADEQVRTALARKIAALAPTLDAESRDRLQRLTYETLQKLVEDAAVSVRAAIADVVKDMPDAPRDLILRLARDVEIPVCGPVLEFSPLLTTEDLLGLIDQPPNPDALAAIARRPHLNETVSDAIAATASSPAIVALLRNGSAQIREATLDSLIAQAADHVEWHEPLVRRPKLSPRAARALAAIVADHLVRALAERPDLDEATAEFLRRQTVKQIAWRGPEIPTHRSDRPQPAEAMAKATELTTRGLLDDTTLLAAATRGEARLVAAMLARAASLPLAVVDRAATLRSAKGLVSLCWKGGFSPKVLEPVQALLGRLPPSGMLVAVDDGWPLSEDEMRWQLAFLMRESRARA